MVTHSLNRIAEDWQASWTAHARQQSVVSTWRNFPLPAPPCSLYSLLSKHADYVGDSWVHTGQRPIAAISVLLRMIYRCRWEYCWRWLYAGESPLEAWHWTRGLSLCVCVLKNTLSLAKGLLSHVCHFSHLPTFVWTQTIKYEMFSFLYPVQW